MPWTGHLPVDQVALISSSSAVVIDFGRFIGVNHKCKFAELSVYEENLVKLFFLKKHLFVNN